MKADEELKAAVSMMLSEKYPIRTKQMASNLQMRNDRVVRQAVHDLVADGNPIISSPEGGIKLAASVDEIDHEMAYLTSYIRNIAIRRRGLKRARVRFAGQLSMSL